MEAGGDHFPAALEAQLEAVVAQRNGDDDGSHDIAHCQRVWKSSQDIAKEVGEPVCLLTLLAASYLHDIVSLEKNDPQRAQASRLAAQAARVILQALLFPGDKIDAVAHAIEAHSYSAGLVPETIEAKILQDADRLDTLGAVGLARIFYVGGRIGTALYDPGDPFAERRELNDSRYSLDHFYTKILKLPAAMNTVPGKYIADRRVAFMEKFLQNLFDEIGVRSVNGKDEISK